MTRAYDIKIHEEALKSLSKVDRARRTKLLAMIEALANDPFPPTSRPLRGDATRRRIRFSSYRIIYEVIADQLIIHVFDVGNRKDVYKKYDRK